MKQAAFSCHATGNWSRRRVWLAPSAFLFNWINAPRFCELSVTLFRRKVLTEKLPKARFDLFLAVIEPAAAACRGGQIAAESGMSPIGSAASDAHAGNKPSVLAVVPESRQLIGSFTTAFLSLKVNEAWRRTLTSLACNFLKNVCHFLLLPSDGASKWRPCFRQAFPAATTDVFSSAFGTKQRKSCLAAKMHCSPEGSARQQNRFHHSPDCAGAAFG